MNKTRQKEIISYLQPLEFKYLYKEEADKVRDYVITKFMEIDMRPDRNYTLGLFNAFLDDSRIKYTPRFVHRHDRELHLKDGKINPNFGKEYWRLI